MMPTRSATGPDLKAFFLGAGERAGLVLAAGFAACSTHKEATDTT